MNTSKIKTIFAALAVVIPLGTVTANAADRDIGSVVTVKKFIGADHTIKITAFEDPKINGVTCFLSRPVTGGISGSFGIAEDKSDASVACRQTGPIKFVKAIGQGPQGEEVFNEDRSIFFKELQVTRFFDKVSNSLVYLTWSDKLIEGSPKNSLSAVTMMPWGTKLPEAPKFIK
ncbi:MAG: hypothetical protein COB76_05820 [Alphaproteobacteria bacterium]|nr:MAG: hypothetical protein COB76_05820 [Alphaproteobacteria bacterium]